MRNVDCAAVVNDAAVVAVEFVMFSAVAVAAAVAGSVTSVGSLASFFWGVVVAVVDWKVCDVKALRPF